MAQEKSVWKWITVNMRNVEKSNKCDSSLAISNLSSPSIMFFFCYESKNVANSMFTGKSHSFKVVKKKTMFLKLIFLGIKTTICLVFLIPKDPV